MPTPTHARLALALALALVLAPCPVARGQDDADVPAANPAADPESARGQGFGWVCMVAAVAAVGGLYVLVRRRQQAAEEDWRRHRGPATAWYCRACDRDVSGPACPHCGAPNPFQHEPLDAGPGVGRIAPRAGDSGHRGPRRPRPARDVGPPDTPPVGRARDAGGAADPEG
jgi:hypothetical protein